VQRFEEPKTADAHAENDTVERNVEPPENEHRESSKGIVFEASKSVVSETTVGPSVEPGNNNETENFASGMAGPPRPERTAGAAEDTDNGEEKVNSSNRLAPVSGILSPGCPAGKEDEMGGGLEPYGAGQGSALGGKAAKRVTFEERLGSAETEAIIQSNGGEAKTSQADEEVLPPGQVEGETNAKTSLMSRGNKGDSKKLPLNRLTSSSALAYDID
jgi:hypothetical protein